MTMRRKCQSVSRVYWIFYPWELFYMLMNTSRRRHAVTQTGGSTWHLQIIEQRFLLSGCKSLAGSLTSPAQELQKASSRYPISILPSSLDILEVLQTLIVPAIKRLEQGVIMFSHQHKTEVLVCGSIHCLTGTPSSSCVVQSSS